MVTPNSAPVTLALVNDHKKPNVPMFEVPQKVMHVKGKMWSSVQDISSHPSIKAGLDPVTTRSRQSNFFYITNRPYRSHMQTHKRQCE